MGDTDMKSIVKKTLNEIKQLEEKVTAQPSITNTSEKKGKVEVQVDTSDEANDSYTENSDIFSMFNRSSQVNSLKVDVQIDEDIDDSSDSIAEGGEDTVYGQGTNPKPEDETYLNLLKKTAPDPKKIKVKVER
jgi:hypothetical protein